MSGFSGPSQFIHQLGRQAVVHSAIVYAGRGGGHIVPKADGGVCYRIELDKLWEAHLPNESFPMIKQEFSRVRSSLNSASRQFGPAYSTT